MPECRAWPLHPTIQILCPCFESGQSLSTPFRRARVLQSTLELRDDLESAHSIANSYRPRTPPFHKRSATVQLHFAILGCCPATNKIRASRGHSFLFRGFFARFSWRSDLRSNGLRPECLLFFRAMTEARSEKH